MADIDNLIRYLNQEAEAQEDYARRAGDMDAYTNAARARARATRLEHMAETAVQLRADRDRLAAENAELREMLREMLEAWDGYEMTAALDAGLRERARAALGGQAAESESEGK